MKNSIDTYVSGSNLTTWENLIGQPDGSPPTAGYWTKMSKICKLQDYFQFVKVDETETKIDVT